MTEYLDHATVDQLHQLAVEVGLDAPEQRAFLLAGINRQFVAQLPRLASPGDQLLSDLLAMQNATLGAGEVPLEKWLANAVSRLGARVERDRFQAALEQVADRREREQPRDHPPGGVEKLVHGYDLLPLDFVTGALRVSSAVARLKVPRVEAGVRRMMPGTQQEMFYFGTGWMLAPGLLITNHHVVNGRSESEGNATPDDLSLQATGTVVEFDYNSEGVSTATEAVVALGAVDQGLDYAVLEVTEHVVRAPLRLASTSAIEAVATARGPVNIIQHAQGAPKALGIRNNLIASFDADDLRYFTDTMAGSSGSPVCADDWQVVALHKAWTYVAQAVEFQGKATAWVNRGTRIDRIVQHLKEHSPETWGKLQP
ncbi:MAG: hypothetical protein QOI99_1164 [Actinomycetota bacterium]|nr:hypothetical protein [Actinomycetota bacterium]